MKNKFYFNSKTQFENFGDAVISRELLKLAKSQGEVHILIKNTPKDFLDIIDNEDYKKYKSTIIFLLSLIISALSNSYTFYLLNPGGFGGDVSQTEKIKQTILVKIYIFFSVLGIKLLRLGASLSNLSEEKAKLEAKKSKYIFYNSYRDLHSIEIARKNAIKVNDSFPDMAFLIQKTILDQNSNKEKNIVLSFRDREKSKNFSVIDKDLIDLEFFKEKTNDYKFIFSSQVEFDKGFNGKLMNLFDKNKFQTEKLDFENKNQYFDLYQSAELVISNRLHVLLFALVSGTKAVALVEKEHDQKIIGIFKDLGFENLICDINDVRNYDWNRINLIPQKFIEDQIKSKKEETYKKFNDLIESIE